MIAAPRRGLVFHQYFDAYVFHTHHPRQTLHRAPIPPHRRNLQEAPGRARPSIPQPPSSRMVGKVAEALAVGMIDE
jgi:hypothetical protein